MHCVRKIRRVQKIRANKKSARDYYGMLGGGTGGGYYYSSSINHTSDHLFWEVSADGRLKKENFEVHYYPREEKQGTVLIDANASTSQRSNRTVSNPRSLMKYSVQRNITVSNPHSLMKYGVQQKISNDLNMNIQKYVWLDRLKTDDWELTDISQNILQHIDTKIIEEYCKLKPDLFMLTYLPETKITTSILIIYCMLYTHEACYDIVCAPKSYPISITTSLGNVLMYVLSHLLREYPWPTKFDTICKYNAYVKPLDQLYLPGNHRACLPNLSLLLQNRIYRNIHEWPTNQMIGYGFTPKLMNELLKEKNKKIYMRLKYNHEFSLLSRKRDHIIVPAHTLKLLILQNRRPAHLECELDFSSDVIPYVQLQTNKFTAKKLYIEVEIHDKTNCFIRPNNQVYLEKVRINLVNGKIPIFK